MITDEMVNAACNAYVLNKCLHHYDNMRAALEAIAPRLRAEGMREAAAMVNPDKHPTSNYAGLWEYRILARAQELDPK